jgi:hypothetical protein
MPCAAQRDREKPSCDQVHRQVQLLAETSWSLHIMSRVRGLRPMGARMRPNCATAPSRNPTERIKSRPQRLANTIVFTLSLRE